jgi:hypothetical protein
VREAAEKAFVLVCSHLACGRAAEVSWLKYTTLKWNPHFRCFFAKVPMTKTHKEKIIAFVAGVDHCDFFLAFADYLSVGPRDVYKEGEIAWVFPHRFVTSRVLGPPLGGGWDRPGPHRTWSVTAQRSMPARSPCTTCFPWTSQAGGWRPGAINILSLCMPAELVVMATCQEPKSVAAVFDYLVATLADSLPVAQSGLPFLPCRFLQLCYKTFTTKKSTTQTEKTTQMWIKNPQETLALNCRWC